MNLYDKWRDLNGRGTNIVRAWRAGSMDAALAYRSARTVAGEIQTFLQADGANLDAQYPGMNFVDSLGIVYDELVKVVNESESGALPSPMLEGIKAGAEHAAGNVRGKTSGFLIAAAAVVLVMLAAKLR